MAASPPVQCEELLNVLTQLSQEIRELDVGSTVDRVPRLSAVEFLRDYVGPNKPVVLTDIIGHWPALTRWTDEYLCNKVGEAEVTVALTPNGRADAVTPLPPGRSCSSSDSSVTECFALPAQRRMPFNEFLQLFYSSKTSPSCSQEGGAANRELAAQKQQGQQQGWHQQEEEQKKKQVPRGQQQGKQRQEDQQQQQHEGKARTAERVVPYLQFQNSSLTAELPQLLEDVDEHFPFATEAFGALPEAINIWIGDERSITSWHKDPFENLYAVVAGEKTFSLLPPSDIYRMRLRNYPLATYQPEGVAADTATAATAAEAEAAGVPEASSTTGVKAGCSGLAASSTALAGAAAAATGANAVPEAASQSAGIASEAQAAGGTSSSAGGQLVPVLHQPRETVLWSSVQPEDGWNEGHATAASGGSSRCSGSSGSDDSSNGSSSDEEGGVTNSGSSGSSGSSSARSRGVASQGQPTWAGDLFSDSQLPRPLRVTVKKGEVLYLPAIWWHQVEQRGDETGRMIAVNYWWDMKFDAKYAYFRAVESLAALAGLVEAPQ